MSLGSPHRTTGELISASIWNTDLIDALNSLGVTADGSTWAGRLFGLTAQSPVSNAYGEGHRLDTVFTKAASGTHPLFSGVIINPPTLSGGGAVVSNAATLVVNGAPAGATDQYSLLVLGTGRSRVYGSLELVTAVGSGMSISDGNAVSGYAGSDGSRFVVRAVTNVGLNLGSNNVDQVFITPSNVTIDLGTNDGEYLTLKSTGDVAHGFTTDTPTAAFGNFRKTSATGGGLAIGGYTETSIALEWNAQYTVGDTTKTTAAGGGLLVQVNKLSGTTAGTCGAGENMFVLRNNTQSMVIFDAEGDMHYHGGSPQGFDEWDDVMLARSLDQTRHAKGLIKTEWDRFVRYNKSDLVRAGIMSEGGMICLQRHTQLLNGAIWQLYLKLQSMTARIAALEA